MGSRLTDRVSRNRQDRCEFIEQFGQLAVHHFDPYTQALSKIERGHQRDSTDVEALVRGGIVDPERLRASSMKASPSSSAIVPSMSGLSGARLTA